VLSNFAFNFNLRHYNLACIFNDDNSEKLLLRIRIMNSEADKGESGDASTVGAHTPPLSAQPEPFLTQNTP
jgi:hypothetical protein